MPNTTPTRVKGIKYGTMEQYNALCQNPGADADMLYFIIDKGLLYRGTSLVVPRNYTTYTPTIASGDVVHDNDQVVFRVETYGNGGEQQGSPLVFTVCTKEAVLAITGTLNAAITGHRSWTEGTGNEQTTVTADGKADATHYGHVKLSDNADANLDADSGTAATPKAVADAISTAMGDLAGAMVFKGTIGCADLYDATQTYAVGEYCTRTRDNETTLYQCTTEITVAEQWNAEHWTTVLVTVTKLPSSGMHVGDTYRVIAPYTYNNHPCEAGDLIICVNTTGMATGNDPDPRWTVAQNNIDGAVTAAGNLTNNCVVVGQGGKSVAVIPSSFSGHILRQGANGPEWFEHTAKDHGIGYHYAVGTSTIQTATIQNFVLQTGAMLTFKASTNLAANCKLNGKYIYYNGAALTAGVVKANDVCTCVYDGTNWVLMAISRNLAQDLPTHLSDLTNDIMGKAICTTASTTMAKEASLTGFSFVEGAFVAVSFANNVGRGATLNINNTGAKNLQYRGSALLNGVIYGGDTCIFVIYNGQYHLLSIDRPFDSVPTSGSHNLVDSDAVYQFVEERTLYWEEMPAVVTE